MAVAEAVGSCIARFEAVFGLVVVRIVAGLKLGQ
jgi:hypothetical protein